MRGFIARGGRVALPIVVAKGQPLVFREWRPGIKMAHGVWKIPIPAEGPEVMPSVVIAPLVGHDPACYRLGYGRSEEHTSELQSLMRSSYALFCLQKKIQNTSNSARCSIEIKRKQQQPPLSLSPRLHQCAL